MVTVAVIVAVLFKVVVAVTVAVTGVVIVAVTGAVTVAVAVAITVTVAVTVVVIITVAVAVTVAVTVVLYRCVLPLLLPLRYTVSCLFTLFLFFFRPHPVFIGRMLILQGGRASCNTCEHVLCPPPFRYVYVFRPRVYVVLLTRYDISVFFLWLSP